MSRASSPARPLPAVEIPSTPPQWALDMHANMTPEEREDLRRSAALESEEGDMDAEDAMRLLREEADRFFTALEACKSPEEQEQVRRRFEAQADDKFAAGLL